jgi:YfiH family protein
MPQNALHPITHKLLSSSAVAHGFFTRQGGVSTGVYESLNCGPGSDDDPAAISENRRRIGAWLTGRDAAPLTAYQVHSARAVIVDRPWTGTPPQADAIVTKARGVVIAALAADCAPVLFADKEAGVIAAAHAGWRGALGGVVDAAVDAMESIGADRRRIHAVVGPCIAQDSYEVGEEFEAEFLKADRANDRFFKFGVSLDKRQFDLAGYVVNRALNLGLADAAAVEADTYSEPDLFFSYRRKQHLGEPDYARLISAICLA